MNTTTKFSDKDQTSRCRGVFDLHIYRNGEEIEHFVEHNLIVNPARTAMAHLAGDADPDKQIVSFGVGVATDEPQLTDEALTEPFVKKLDSHEYPEDEPYNVQFNFSLSTEEANGMDITEFGLLCADGSLFAHKVRKMIGKDSDISLSGSWTILF